MSLADEYECQSRRRAWTEVIDALPITPGQTVLDLGCAVGAQSALLAARGCRVVGCDANHALLDVARSRGIEGARFLQVDLRDLGGIEVKADGLWCSYTAAYFVDFPPVLAHWMTKLRPGAWVALVEVDDLFAHAPLDAEARSIVEGYVEHALAAGRYDFCKGRRLADEMRQAGLVVTHEMTVNDPEFTQSGALPAEIVEAWRARLDRMRLLQEHCGARWDQVRAAFLACLRSDGHSSGTTVRGCIGVKP
jgi:SAM-dependent methyltransferase